MSLGTLISSPPVESESGFPRLRDQRYSFSLDRGLAILEMFTPEHPVLGVNEIATQLGLSPASAHRYITTLVALGYLEQEPSRKYRLALRVTDLGMGTLNGTSLREHANPHMRALVQRANFTCSLAVLDGTDIVIVERLRAVHRRGYQKSALNINVESRLPAAVTAMGKLLLAHLPRWELYQRLTEITLKSYGPHTITRKATLRIEFAAIRDLGIATNDEELERGFYAIAAAVRDQRDVIAAVNLLAPRQAITLPDLVNDLGPHLVATADEISARLGHRLNSSENGCE